VSDKFPGGLITTGAPAGFSVALNGSSDYLTLPQISAYNIGTGAFTCEAWIYPTTALSAGGYGILNLGDGAVGGGPYTGWGLIINYSSSTTFTLAWYRYDGTTETNLNTTTTLGLNQWYHIAAVRSGTNLSLYINGVRGYTTASSTISYNNINTNPLYVGRRIDGAGGGSNTRYFGGYISNARLVVGTAVYDPTATTINVPTQLFPVTNTQLLTCQSPTIIDNSTNAATITVVSGAKASNFTPFAGYTGFNPALGAAAGGVWTLDEAAYYQNNRQWPIYDPYFNQTTLMLHGNGTNGAQNNTFLDSSTNNFTITRNGNTTQGTFTPFSQTGWSNYFGSSDYLSASNNAAFAFGTGDFTIEFWYFPASLTLTNNCFLDTRTAGGNATGIYIKVGDAAGGGTTTVYAGFGGTQYSTTGLSNATWNHIAVTRNGTSVRVFINGISGTVGTSSQNLSDQGFLINKFVDASGNGSNGYLSNIRLVKGTALYTSNFTPSTQSLTAVTNTVMLTGQSQRFVDNSANNFTLTPSGSPSVQAFSPFVPAYITPTTYSNYFNGSSGYLTLASNAAFSFGTGAFTWETWFFSTGAASGDDCFYDLGSANTSGGFAVFTTGSTLYVRINGTGQDLTYSLPSNWANTWHHLAVVRSGTTLTIYLDGISVASGTRAQDVTQSSPYIGNGAGVLSAYYFSGCLSNMRVVKGTAVYTANFTPPTAPLTNITNTSLLTCQSSTLIDNSTANSGSGFTITATGTVYPVTSPTPFPAKVDQTTLNTAYSTSLIGGSAYFDGTGDYLTTSSGTSLGSGNFTIEAWVYLTAAAAGETTVGSSADYYTAGFNGNFVFRVGTQNLWRSFDAQSNQATIDGTFTWATGQWYHMAWVRNSGTVTVYRNGVSLGSVADSKTLSDSTNGYAIAATKSSGSYSSLLTGYISNLRVVVGTALYTSSFAPPTAPLTAITNTSLLLSSTNGAIFDNTAKNVLETVGNAQISTTQSKYGGSSMYFDGTGDWLLAPTSPNVGLGTGNFTFETWVYPTTNPANGPGTIIDARNSATSEGWVVRIFPDLSIGFYDGPANTYQQTSASAVSLNTWAHVACVRSGTTLTIFVNGVSLKTATVSSNLGTTWPFYIGNNYTAGYTYYGYLDDLRITKGVARYTTNFTPPTSQLQDQ
jgi:hypothetical protein